MNIAIIGGTGTIGSRVVAQLAKTDATVTALARTVVAAAAVRRAGAQPIRGDLADREAVTALVAGADSILLLTANGPDQLEQERRVIEINAASGRAPIIKVSVQGAADDAPLSLGRVHHAVEEDLRASGVDHVIVRPGWLMQNVALARSSLIVQHELALPIGSGAVAAVDASDVAAACCVALTDLPRFVGVDLVVIGAEDVTGESMASGLSVGTHRTIAFRDITREAFEQTLSDDGLDSDLTEDLGVLYDVIIRNSFLAGPNASVEEITGLPAATFATFALREGEQFATAT